MGNTPSIVQSAEADAIRARGTAEAKAITMRAAAEAKAIADRVSIDTERAAAEAKAIAESLHTEKMFKAAPFLIFGACAGVLALDYALHDVRGVQLYRMMRKLRKGALPVTAELRPARPLPVVGPRLRMELGKVPTMVLGESGSGKSTELALTARELVTPPPGSDAPPCPVVYIRMRQPKLQKAASEGAPDGDSTSEATARLANIAQQVFAQIGFPQRESIVSMLWSRFHSVTYEGVKTELRPAAYHRDRLSSALRLLFEAAERLWLERKAAGVAPEHAPIVLLFDEVQDLVKRKRLAEVGGRFVFEELGTLLVAYGVDRGAVRSAVAGSSAVLAIEFDKTGLATGARWRYHKMIDPAPSVVIGALVERGYTDKEAAAMVQLVGTRLRLLETPLDAGPAACTCEAFLATSRESAAALFRGLLRGATISKGSILETLERIVAYEAGQGAAPMFEDLCEASLEADFSKVLYVRLDHSITFQSQLHRTVWREIRGQFVRELQ